MNINNINDAGNPQVPKRSQERGQDVPAAGTERTEIAPEGSQAVQQAPEPEEAPVASTNRDSFRASNDQRLVDELTSRVESMDEAPREDRVSQARDRVSTGYYNTDEMANNIAMSLINTEQQNG